MIGCWSSWYVKNSMVKCKYCVKPLKLDSIAQAGIAKFNKMWVNAIFDGTSVPVSLVHRHKQASVVKNRTADMNRKPCLKWRKWDRNRIYATNCMPPAKMNISIQICVWMLKISIVRQHPYAQVEMRCIQCTFRIYVCVLIVPLSTNT